VFEAEAEQPACAFVSNGVYQLGGRRGVIVQVVGFELAGDRDRYAFLPAAGGGSRRTAGRLRVRDARKVCQGHDKRQEDGERTNPQANGRFGHHRNSFSHSLMEATESRAAHAQTSRSRRMK
jgi:hypothetical protein